MTISHEDVKAELLSNPEVRKAYDDLEPAYQVARLRQLVKKYVDIILDDIRPVLRFYADGGNDGGKLAIEVHDKVLFEDRELTKEEKEHGKTLASLAEECLARPPALDLAGAWCDLVWEDVEQELDRIRHEPKVSGWQCPVCKKVWGPQVVECSECDLRCATKKETP